MITTFNGRQVEITDVQHGADPCDSFIVAAVYVDDEADVTDEDLDVLTEESSALLDEAWYEYQQGRAEYYADMREDR